MSSETDRQLSLSIHDLILCHIYITPTPHTLTPYTTTVYSTTRPRMPPSYLITQTHTKLLLITGEIILCTICHRTTQSSPRPTVSSSSAVLSLSALFVGLVPARIAQARPYSHLPPFFIACVLRFLFVLASYYYLCAVASLYSSLYHHHHHHHPSSSEPDTHSHTPHSLFRLSVRLRLCCFRIKLSQSPDTSNQTSDLTPSFALEIKSSHHAIWSGPCVV